MQPLISLGLLVAPRRLVAVIHVVSSQASLVYLSGWRLDISPMTDDARCWSVELLLQPLGVAGLLERPMPDYLLHHGPSIRCLYSD